MTKTEAAPLGPGISVRRGTGLRGKGTYFHTALDLLNASVVLGLLSALTPISIVFGAIFFFVVMEDSGAMNILRAWLHNVPSNRVAQLIVVGWSFQFLIEGASGFGTPAAQAAPILIGLGFPALPIAMLCLIMNTIPVSVGAVGTPLWFGFGSLELTNLQLVRIGLNVAILQVLASLIIPVVALRFVVAWSEIRAHLAFIYLSVLASVLPMLALATFNYEVPAVVGGLIGLFATILLARLGLGLKPGEPSTGTFLSRPVLAALAPLVATVLVLLVTRIPAFGFRECIHNIAAVCAVLGVVNKEGQILKQCLYQSSSMESFSHLLRRCSFEPVHKHESVPTCVLYDVLYQAE